MGEKGNVADVRGVGGHVASTAQSAARAQTLGLGGEPLGTPAPPPPGGSGGGILSDLADAAKDKVTDVGLGGRGGVSGIVGGNKDDEDDNET